MFDLNFIKGEQKYDRVHRLIIRKMVTSSSYGQLYMFDLHLSVIFFPSFCLYNEFYIQLNLFLELNMKVRHFLIVLIISISCFAGPLEDIANMPDLTLVSLRKKVFF